MKEFMVQYNYLTNKLLITPLGTPHNVFTPNGQIYVTILICNEKDVFKQLYHTIKNRSQRPRDYDKNVMEFLKINYPEYFV
jgi:predicted RNA-binding protein associated with RNAse of E/G family